MSPMSSRSSAGRRTQIVCKRSRPLPHRGRTSSTRSRPMITATNTPMLTSAGQILATSSEKSYSMGVSSGPGSGARVDAGAGFVTTSGLSSSGYSYALLRPGALDVVERGLGVLGAVDPVRHAGPEGLRANRARHQVGTVEPRDGAGVLEDLHRQLVDRVGDRADVQALVGGDPVSELRAAVGPFARGQVGLHLHDLVAVGERRHELTGDQHWLALAGVDRREVEREDVAVLRHLGALRPLVGVEGRLAVQAALLVLDRQASLL